MSWQWASGWEKGHLSRQQLQLDVMPQATVLYLLMQAATEVDAMQKELTQAKVVVEAATQECNELLEVITTNTADVEQKQEVAMKTEQELKVKLLLRRKVWHEIVVEGSRRRFHSLTASVHGLATCQYIARMNPCRSPPKRLQLRKRRLSRRWQQPFLCWRRQLQPCKT